MDVVTSQRWMLGSLNFICGCFYITPLKPLFLPGIPWSLLLDINGTFLHHTRGWTFLLDTMVVVTGLWKPDVDFWRENSNYSNLKINVACFCKNETFWGIFRHCDVSGFSASLNSNWETRLRGIYFCCYFRTRSNNISFLGRAAAVEERLLCVLEKVGSCQKVAKESSSVWCNQIHIKEMHFSHKDNMMKVLLKKVYKSKLYYS